MRYKAIADVQYRERDCIGLDEFVTLSVKPNYEDVVVVST